VKRVFKLLPLLILIILFPGCGNRKSPTGGKVDTENPAVATIIPEEYSNISGKHIEITFSKPIDRNSIYEGERGINFYPMISEKRFRWSDNTLTVEINQELEPERNYYLNLSDQIRDLRNNNLDRNYTFVFHTGRLQNNRIYGDISYEREADRGLSVNCTLLSIDSLRIFSREITGDNYSIENLEEKDYLLRAFIDKNRNKRYDINTDPYYETSFRAENNNQINISLEYFDDSPPEILSLSVDFNNLLSVRFDKPIRHVETINISTADTLHTNLELITYDFFDDEMEIITTPMDSLEYRITLNSVIDYKDNTAETIEREFEGVTRADSTGPEIVGSIPRNGAVVHEPRPELFITFNKFMIEDNIDLQMTDTISGEIIELDVNLEDSRQIKIKPKKNLSNRTPYRLRIMDSSKDMSGNKLAEDYLLQFLPIYADF